MCQVCERKGFYVFLLCIKMCVYNYIIPILNVRARVFGTEDTEHHEHHDQEERRHSHAHTVHRQIADELIAVQETVH